MFLYFQRYIRQFWPYFLLVVTLATLLFFRYLLLKEQVQKNTDYHAVIHLADHQTTLCLQIINACLQWQDDAPNTPILFKIEKWNALHQQLQQYIQSRPTSLKRYPEILVLLAKINPLQQKLHAAFRRFVTRKHDAAFWRQLQGLEQDYQEKMNALETLLQWNRKEDVLQLQNFFLRTGIGAAIFLLLIIRLFLYPYHRKLIRSYQQIKEQQADLTEKNNRIITLYDANERIISGINAGIWDWDLGMNTLTWSPRLYHLLGYTAGEITASCNTLLHVLLHPDDRAKTKHALRLHLENQVPYKTDIRLLCKDGQYKWFETSGQAKWSAEGKPLRITGSIIDIDERIRYKQQMEHNDFLLEEAGKMASLGGWEYIIDTNKIRWTKAMYAIHEREPGKQETMDRNLDHYPPEYHSLINDTLEKCTSQKKPFDIELQLTTARGNLKWIRSMGSPLINKAGKVTGFRGVYQDITPQKVRELQITDAKNKLDESNRIKNKLFSIISHDLKGPLGNLLQLLELQETEAISQEEFCHYTNDVKRNVDFLYSTMENLLAWAQNQMNGFIVQRKPHRIATVADEALQLYRKAIDLKQLKVCICGDSTAQAWVDADNLLLVMRNFLSNAIKFTPQNGTITLCLSQKDTMCFVTIADSGIGIRPEDLAQLKNKGTLLSTYGTHGEKGTGLGISLCYEMARNNGFSIAIESEMKKGTTVTIGIPLQEAPTFISRELTSE